MSEFAVQSLLQTPTVAIRDVYCDGSHRQPSPEECANATELVFPYRGVYMRHLGNDQAVAEANQVLFFNAREGYRVSHPVPGGDASLALIISETWFFAEALRKGADGHAGEYIYAHELGHFVCGCIDEAAADKAAVQLLDDAHKHRFSNAGDGASK